MISGVPTNYIVTPIKDDYKATESALNLMNEKRRIRHMRFPSLKYRHDIDSFQLDINANNSLKKWNDDGEHHSSAPCRAYDNLIEPTSGFVSAGADVNNNNCSNKVKLLVQLNTTPQSVNSKKLNKVHFDLITPSKLQRENTWSPETPLLWNSKKKLDVVMRAKLGGWTSSVDPRKLSEEAKRPQTSPLDELSRMRRDKLALKYQYGTSTQRAYEEVPWDSILPPKVQPPSSTLENRPDSVSHQLQTNRYEISHHEWQSVGKGLDTFLLRKGYYKDGPISFCSPYPRYQQIPSYSGSVGAENLEEVDNVKEEFIPFSVKRSIIPTPSETAHRPNIPWYTGCTLWQGSYAPFQINELENRYPHPKIQTLVSQKPQSPESYKRKSEVSKMVTLVPPKNPFNTIETEPLQV
ncbi:spermatogenesis-associated protein 48 [Biomphalaria pfeifferi]|uniref:Spermatogenesis-associated protein 48 n=1 Tax=Biomphalaria pfeifferi TaxID=112525 RepID=A0AAD8FBV7_BIOPF|nr:spermatogenesis-associated protein 48 [Biomphalaria pfeifferi]